MDMILLLIMATSELCAASSHGQHHYHFVYELKTMTDALSYCREKYIDLATVDNMDDVNILVNMAASHKAATPGYKDRVWIGLYDDTSSWRWSLTDEIFYKGVKFQNWNHFQPDNLKAAEYCVGMYDFGGWFDYYCDNSLPAFCVDITGPNVTFVLTSDNMTWSESQSYCRAHHTDLATVRNMAENQKMAELLSESGGDKVWIGLFRESWKWSDGSTSSFRYWRQEGGEPNNISGKEACVVAEFSLGGKWADIDCDVKIPFLCTVVPVSKQVMKVRLMKMGSSLDLNDPAVMEDILKQLKQRLKDEGVNEDVSLSWRKQLDGQIFHKEEEEEETKTKSNCPTIDEL